MIKENGGVYFEIKNARLKDGFKTDYISEAVKNGGFDLSFAVEKQVLRTLDVGMYTRVPLVPGRLNYKMTANVYANFIETKALGFIDNTEEHSLDYGVDDITYSTASFAAFRPFKLGIEVAWRPFGKWMVFRPELAVVMRNPYSTAAIIYPEYSLGAEFSLFNVVRLQAATAYRDRVFVQSVGVALNVRLIEIELGAAFRGAEFTNSFNYSGAGAFAAVRIGF